MRQLIIARKDLHMSPGKLAAQVSHASLAFLTHAMRDEARVSEVSDHLEVTIPVDREVYEEWVSGIHQDGL